MKLLFLILAHERPQQVAQLCEALVAAAEDAVALVHYDARAPEADFAALREAVAGHRCIRLVERRVACRWGAFGLVEAPLNALAQAEAEGLDPDYAILLSGACLPCRPVAQLERYLAEHDGREFIEIEDESWIGDGWRSERWRYRFWFDHKTQHPMEWAFLQIQRALGLSEPEFLHLGLILGPDGKKLSKRYGSAAVSEYRAAGYLPGALASYLALLGWSHPESREEFESLDELVREWNPSRLGASPATFDPERLLALNAALIRRLPPDELRRLIEPFLKTPLPEGREEVAVAALQQEMRTPSEAQGLLEGLVGEVEPREFAGELPESSVEVFERAAEELARLRPEDLERAREFVAAMRGWAKERGIKTREVLHPLRLALTGQNRGPELAYPVAALGAQESRERIDRAREARLRV